MARFRSCFLSSVRTLTRSSHRPDEAGQVMMLAGLLLPILLGAAGLAVDLGIVAARHRAAQNAVDAAALAGAGVLHDGGSVSSAHTAARGMVQENGFASSEATVNIPPQSGPHTGDNSYVEVLVSHQQPTIFMRVLHINTTTTRARAVAKISRVKNYALVVLDDTKCSAFNQSSNNTLTLVNGGAMVNSSCKPSGSQGGGSTLNSTFIDYYSAGSWSQANNASSSSTPTAASARLADPLASLTRPVPGAASPDSGGNAASPKLLNIQGGATLHPGTYYGGIKISSSAAVTFLPGVYVMSGGGLTYSGSGTLSGNGVTFFNTDDPSAGKKGAGDCASIDLQGSGSLSLVAPSSGATTNMLFWQSDTCTQPLKYAGSTYTTTGIIYLPKAELDVSGGGNMGALQIIVDSFQYTGSTSVTVDCGNFITLGPIALVE